MHVRSYASLVRFSAVAAALVVSGCAALDLVAALPVAPPANGSPVAPAPPVVEPPVVVAPVEPPAAEPAPAPAPERDLELFVLDGAGNPILTGQATIHTGGGHNPGGSETRKVTDPSGRIHFPVRGAVLVLVEAPGYRPATRDVPPGRHNVNLESLTPPAPVVVPGPSVPAPRPLVAVCGSAFNSDRVSRECLQTVADASVNWPKCEAGDAVACHRYVREVVVALKTAQNDPRWGLIKKSSGQSCSETECGDVGGYGEDVVAYLPEPISLDAKTWRWRGADIVGGAGAPGARFQWGALHEAIKCDGEPRPWCNREGDVWAPVPKQ